ncbi:MAG: DUF58 domain-containing protein, partial [Rhodoferax sp.]|nr:DUF58 domain-containing protein [Actinomycetota bacterium]
APRLDASLVACLLLAALAARAGDRVDLLAHDRHLRAYVTGGTGASLLPRLVEAMAPLQASLVETDLQAVSHEVLTRVRARSLVVLFTALDPAPVEQGLLPALSALTARHTVMVAAVSGPAVAALAPGRADAGVVYAAAAAESALAGRRAVTQQLRRRGVEVVEAPPERLAPAVADAYLALKAAGRL